MDHGIARVDEEIDREATRACVPLTASAELTLSCNIRCVHCYNFDRNLPRPQAGNELSFDEWKRVFRELKEAGTLYLGLTGGEAMVHPRFWDLLDEAAALRFAVTVLTNGTLLTEEACGRLAEVPAVACVSLSVYGATPAVHDAITRSRGSWERTVRGAERMRERGVSVELKFVVLKGNAHEVGGMNELADRLGLAPHFDTTITGRYDGTGGSLATRIDIPTVAEIYRGPLRPQLSKRDPDAFLCKCARTNCAIFSSGDVTPCIAVPLAAGNVRKQSFGEIWRNAEFFRRIRSLHLEDFRTCAPCPLRAWCRHEPGAPSALHGDYTGVDPWVCEEAAVIQKILESE